MNSPRPLFVSSTTNVKNMPTWLGVSITIAIIVAVREASVWASQQFGIATAGNIVGLVVMFLILIIWRILRQNSAKKTTLPSSSPPALAHLPHWLTNASNKLLIDSGFAFLPVSAGAGLLLMGLGDEMWGIIITLVVSTLVPMWALAKIADTWLKEIKIPPSN